MDRFPSYRTCGAADGGGRRSSLLRCCPRIQNCSRTTSVESVSFICSKPGLFGSSARGCALFGPFAYWPFHLSNVTVQTDHWQAREKLCHCTATHMTAAERRGRAADAVRHPQLLGRRPLSSGKPRQACEAIASHVMLPAIRVVEEPRRRRTTADHGTWPRATTTCTCLSLPSDRRRRPCCRSSRGTSGSNLQTHIREPAMRPAAFLRSISGAAMATHTQPAQHMRTTSSRVLSIKVSVKILSAVCCRGTHAAALRVSCQHVRRDAPCPVHSLLLALTAQRAGGCQIAALFRQTAASVMTLNTGDCVPFRFLHSGSSVPTPTSKCRPEECRGI